MSNKGWLGFVALLGVTLCAGRLEAQSPMAIAPPNPSLLSHLGVTFGDLPSGRPKPVQVDPKAAGAVLGVAARVQPSSGPADCGMPILRSNPDIDPKIAQQPDAATRFSMRTMPAPACPGK